VSGSPLQPIDGPEMNAAVEAERRPSDGAEPRRVRVDVSAWAIAKLMAGLLLLGVVGNLAHQIRDVLVWAAAALFLAVALNPLVARLEPKLGRTAAALVVFLGFIVLLLAALAALVAPFVTQVDQLTTGLPNALQDARHNHTFARLDERTSEQITVEEIRRGNFTRWLTWGERWQLLRENRALLAGLKESNERLTALHDAIARLGGINHLDRTLDELVTSARSLLGAERARAVLFEPGPDGTLRVTHASGDGAELLEGARMHPQDGLLPHVVARRRAVTLEWASADPHYASRSDDLEATRPGFLCVPVVHGHVLGALAAAGRETPFGELDLRLAGSLATQAATALDNAVKNERAVNFFTHTCDLLVKFLDLKDVNLAGHSLAVAALADMITRRLGLPDEERRVVHFAALLHDIGKLRLEPDLLDEGRRLDPEQFARMKAHAALGVDLLKPITHWQGMLPLIHSHHERWDGTGYPNGLAGEAIPLGARVIAVADTFDAMTRGYPGRPARQPAQALAELQANAGTQFDPRLVRLFVAAYEEGAP